MNLFYLAGSLAGIGLLVALNLVLMGRAQVRVDLDSAKALLALEHPGFRAGNGAAAPDGTAALIEDDKGTLYLVAAAGDGLVSRKLPAGSLRALARDGDTLSICLHDMTFPHARFALAGTTQAQAWEARLARALG